MKYYLMILVAILFTGCKFNEKPNITLECNKTGYMIEVKQWSDRKVESLVCEDMSFLDGECIDNKILKCVK